MNRSKMWLHRALRFIQLLVGTALTAAAFGMIIIPQGFAAGGVTGLARILSGVIPVPLSAVVFALNMILLGLGLVFVGKTFVAKTVAVSVIFPAMLEVFSRFPLESLTADPLVSTVIAGAMLGTGTGMVLRSGASCGGFDILGVVLNRKLKIPVGTVMNVCDTTIIVLQALGQPLLQTVYGILVISISAMLVTKVMTLGTGESQVLVFSEQYDAIRQAFLRDLDVGMTCLNAEAGFRQTPIKVIVSVMPYEKLAQMRRIIMDIDPTAFVVVDQVSSVLGKGYTLDKHFQPPEAG